MSNEVYMLDESGKLFRQGVQIGAVNENQEIVLLPEHVKFKSAVTRWLAAKQEDAETTDETAPPVPEKKGDDADTDELESLTQEAKGEAAKARDQHGDDLQYARAHKLPDPPKKNPQFGDKTPGYVEWLKRHRPEVFAKRYGVKRTGKVAVFEKDADGVEQHKGYRDAEMSLRKTHLTEKVETDRGLADDMSWEA